MTTRRFDVRSITGGLTALGLTAIPLVVPARWQDPPQQPPVLFSGLRQDQLLDLRGHLLFGHGLQRFAGSGGGAFFQIEVDSDPFVDRALRETSASYLLAVRVEPADRDGKEHFIRVAVKQGGATVQYRRIVTIPRPGDGRSLFPQMRSSPPGEPTLASMPVRR